MICKKVSELEQLPVSCTSCPFFDESILRHGGIEVSDYLSCSQQPGESLGCTNLDLKELRSRRSEKCPLAEVSG